MKNILTYVSRHFVSLLLRVILALETLWKWTCHLYQLLAIKHRQRKQNKYFLNHFYREQLIIDEREPTLDELLVNRQAQDNYNQYMTILRAMPIAK